MDDIDDKYVDFQTQVTNLFSCRCEHFRNLLFNSFINELGYKF